jgi:hypothetical protein
MTRLAVLVLGATAASALSCARQALPDPRAAAAEFAAAAQRGDADAVHAMLTEDARRAFGPQGTRRLLNDARTEIARSARGFSSPKATVRAVAAVPFVDGEQSLLDLEAGRFRVSASAGLPAGARTPAQALGELRGAIARRSYAALVRVLSAETRSALEGDMRTLVEGLEHPDTLDVHAHGETAEVEVPGGHKVLLKREAGVWKVVDFD